jgi:glycosyltransferase involved in cell wall biosynthesis
MTRARKLHWLCDSPSPYNAQLFRALTAEPNVDLLVHYRRIRLSSHPWQSNLMEGYASRPYDETLGADWQLMRLALALPKRFCSDAFVIAGWNHPTAWLLLALLALRRGNFVIWTDTPNPASNRPLWLQWARQTFLRWVFGRARYIMGTGTPAINVMEKMGAPRSKLINFPYWIDVSLYDGRRQRDAQANGNLVFLSCGRLQNDLKGHDVALRAFALGRSEGADPFEYRIAGTGPDAEKLQHLAEELGLCDRIKLLGWLDPADVIEEMKAAHVLIHPSPVHEPYGVAVIEAMAAGMVVLASDATCAALDRIELQVNGFIHRAGDFGQLAAQIRDLLENRDKLTRMGPAARRTAEQWPLSRAVTLIMHLLEGSPQA